MHPDIEKIIIDRLMNGLSKGDLTAEEQMEIDVLIGSYEVIVGHVALKLEIADAFIAAKGFTEEFNEHYQQAKKEFIRKSLANE